MREILFRGFHECEDGTQKAFYNGEWHKGKWVYGGIVHQTDYYGLECDKWFIIDGEDTLDYEIGENYKVAPETVCQYTEINDKNGKKIFEGDVLKVYQYSDGFGTYYDPPKETGQNVVVYWDLCAWSWKNTDDRHYWSFPSAWVHYKGKVIGNKFENSELLEVEE